MKDTSQTERIKAYLLKGKTLTALQALKLFGCLRLASRINELRETHTITRERVKLSNGKVIMKYGIAFTLMLFLLSCNTQNTEIKSTDVEINGRKISIYIIDGCEYIGNVYGGHGDWMTHKGNCKNHQKEYEKQVN